jgi:hypothetical protein
MASYYKHSVHFWANCCRFPETFYNWWHSIHARNLVSMSSSKIGWWLVGSVVGLLFLIAFVYSLAQLVANL